MLKDRGMLADLRERLVEDEWRRGVGFSPDIERANNILLRKDSLDSERQVVMERWLQGHGLQPCIFGKAAAKFASMHFCFLTDDDLDRTDGHIRDKIEDSRMIWKRRALGGIPTHGFMLVVCDERVLRARPDAALRDFAFHVQGLVGWEEASDERGNDIVSEWLYLTNPETHAAMRFTFSVDFFASAGDGRWWKDHRVPGGIAFTANSLGHMYWQNRWYGGEKEGKKAYSIEWALRVAMNTIDSAAGGGTYCPATYLLPQGPEGPRRACRWAESIPPPQGNNLKGRDITSYEGYLHTDHAVRAEFFDGGEKPAHFNNPYLMDFTYIYDDLSFDNLPFMRGVPVPIKEVEAELGLPEPVRAVSMTTGDPEIYAYARPAAVAEEIEAAIESTREWELSSEELDDLMS